jgi:hypothetical protein
VEIFQVVTVPFDLIVELAVGAGSVRLLKLDCEGSEWPILFTSRRLGHSTRVSVQRPKFAHSRFNREDLREVRTQYGVEAPLLFLSAVEEPARNDLEQF